MPNTINASTTSTTGLVQTADGSGILQLQSDGTTGLTISSGGKVVLANTALSTASVGTLEYDGGELYFTPLSTQRGLVSSAQYFRLDSGLVGANVSTAQSLFGVGVTLSSSTVYAFESVFAMSKTAGTTSHTTSLGFGGTATINNIGYHLHNQFDSTAFTTVPYSGTVLNQWINSATNTTISGGSVSAGAYRVLYMRGTVSINTGGTFIPQYTLSAAPGGAYTTQIGSYFLIYPIGASGSNVSIGTWA
jgi:hypothetical protein